MQIQKLSFFIFIFKAGNCIVVLFEVNSDVSKKKEILVCAENTILSKRELGMLTGANVAIMFVHTAVSAHEKAPLRISMLTLGCYKFFH